MTIWKSGGALSGTSTKFVSSYCTVPFTYASNISVSGTSIHEVRISYFVVGVQASLRLQASTSPKICPEKTSRSKVYKHTLKYQYRWKYTNVLLSMTTRVHFLLNSEKKLKYNCFRHFMFRINRYFFFQPKSHRAIMLWLCR